MQGNDLNPEPNPKMSVCCHAMILYISTTPIHVQKSSSQHTQRNDTHHRHHRPRLALDTQSTRRALLRRLTRLTRPRRRRSIIPIRRRPCRRTTARTRAIAVRRTIHRTKIHHNRLRRRDNNTDSPVLRLDGAVRLPDHLAHPVLVEGERFTAPRDIRSIKRHRSVIPARQRAHHDGAYIARDREAESLAGAIRGRGGRPVKIIHVH